MAYNHQGERVGQPHVAIWAQPEVMLAADLGSGTDDVRAGAPGLLRRALACLPAAAREHGQIAARADAGYFAGALAGTAREERIAFAIGAKRIAPLWTLLDGIAEDDWHDAAGMHAAQVAVSGYCPVGREGPILQIGSALASSPGQLAKMPGSKLRVLVACGAASTSSCPVTRA